METPLKGILIIVFMSSSTSSALLRAELSISERGSRRVCVLPCRFRGQVGKGTHSDMIQTAELVCEWVRDHLV